MLTGIYAVSFTSEMGNFGMGIAVFTGSGVYGGDFSYFYKGNLSTNDNMMSGDIQVAHYQGPMNSILGPLKQFTLRVSGTPSEPSFVLNGSIIEVPNQKIAIQCKKISDL